MSRVPPILLPPVVERETTVKPKPEPVPLELLQLPELEGVFAWLIAHKWRITSTKGGLVCWTSPHRWMVGDDDHPTGEPVEAWFPLQPMDGAAPQKKGSRDPDAALRAGIGVVADRTGMSAERLVGAMTGKGRDSDVCELIGLGGNPAHDHYELWIDDDTVILDQASSARGGKLLWYAEDNGTVGRGGTWRESLASLAAALDSVAAVHRGIADRCAARAEQVRAWLAARPHTEGT